MRRRKPISADRLGARLDTLVETFDVTTIAPDPLQLVLRYDDPRDQETAGLIAAAFAYGRADIIVSNIGAVLDKMGTPYAYLATFDPREATKRFAGFAHRFHKTPELVAFLTCIATAIRDHGSLGALFETCYDANDPDIGPTLTRFVETLRSAGFQPAGPWPYRPPGRQDAGGPGAWKAALLCLRISLASQQTHRANLFAERALYSWRERLLARGTDPWSWVLHRMPDDPPFRKLVETAATLAAE
jgi:hypothetical protein